MKYTNGDEDKEKEKKKDLARYDEHGVHKGTADLDTRVSEATKKRRKGAQSLAERNMARMMKQREKKTKKLTKKDDVQSAKKDLMKDKL